MQSSSLIVGVLAGLVSMAQIGVMVSLRIRRVRAAHRGVLRQLEEASATVREKARVTLHLKREARQMERETGSLGGRIERGEAAVTQFRRNADLLHVLDERRNATDLSFTVDVSHPDFSQISAGAPGDVVASWRAGRSFLVFAASEKMARAKVAHRLPADKGYVLGKLAPFDGDPDEF